MKESKVVVVVVVVALSLFSLFFSQERAEPKPRRVFLKLPACIPLTQTTGSLPLGTVGIARRPSPVDPPKWCRSASQLSYGDGWTLGKKKGCTKKTSTSKWVSERKTQEKKLIRISWLAGWLTVLVFVFLFLDLKAKNKYTSFSCYLTCPPPPPSLTYVVAPDRPINTELWLARQ